MEAAVPASWPELLGTQHPCFQPASQALRTCCQRQSWRRPAREQHRQALDVTLRACSRAAAGASSQLRHPHWPTRPPTLPAHLHGPQVRAALGAAQRHARQLAVHQPHLGARHGAAVEGHRRQRGSRGRGSQRCCGPWHPPSLGRAPPSAAAPAHRSVAARASVQTWCPRPRLPVWIITQTCREGGMAGAWASTCDGGMRQQGDCRPQRRAAAGVAGHLWCSLTPAACRGQWLRPGPCPPPAWPFSVMPMAAAAAGSKISSTTCDGGVAAPLADERSSRRQKSAGAAQTKAAQTTGGSSAHLQLGVVVACGQGHEGQAGAQAGGWAVQVAGGQAAGSAGGSGGGHRMSGLPRDHSSPLADRSLVPSP